MKYFTYLWKNDTWKRKIELCNSGYTALDYAAGEKFSSSGISTGSTVFIVTVMEGLLYLGGKIVVDKVLDRTSAAAHLGKDESDLWSATEYIVAETSCLDNFRPNLQVDDVLARSLEFAKPGGGFVNMKFDPDGKINSQTLRAPRALYSGEHKKLLSLL